MTREEEGSQRPIGLVGRFLGEVVAAIEGVARDVVGPIAPDGENVVPSLELRTPTPQGEHRAGDAAPSAIGLVVLAIDAGGGAVVFADGVNGRLVKQRS